MTWETKEGKKSSNYFGSVTQASSFRVGRDASNGNEVYAPLKNLLPMVDPSSLKLSGWDINGARLGDAMRRAGVLDYDLQRQLYDELQSMPPPLPPLPGSSSAPAPS